MYIKKLKLEKYRTYENLEIKLEKNLNIFYGENAIGKTNILEAIYFSCITKSYRTIKDIECINFNNEYMKIYSTFENNEREDNVCIYLDKENNKKITSNDILINKYSTYIGKFPVVIFSPESLNIIKGSPKERRKFLDILISQISKSYFISLQEYKKTLKIKNVLLKNNPSEIDYTYLDILDESLSKNISKIVYKRKNFVKKINYFSKKIQQEISNNKEEIEIKYITDFYENNDEENLKILKNSRDNDIVRKTSNKGIGHDDLNILVNKKDVTLYGSQGQIRSAALSLKLAEVDIIKEIKEEDAIILLDDVLSELDKIRINNLLSILKKNQVIITTTEIEDLIDIKNKKNINIMKVNYGNVEKK